MKIIWSQFATEQLKEIYCYHKSVANIKTAQKIKSNIFSSVKQLIIYSDSGQIEKILERLHENHRYLVCGNYKIVYKKVSQGILITDVFDTRRNPIGINDINRRL